MIDGQVTKVDQSAGKITIKHGPIKKLGMDEGMTMVFRAQDPKMLKAVKAGDRVRFDCRRRQWAVNGDSDRENEEVKGPRISAPRDGEFRFRFAVSHRRDHARPTLTRCGVLPQRRSCGPGRCPIKSDYRA